MPLTLLHYPVGFGLSKASKRLSLPGLLVGSVIPDIEVPLIWTFFPGVPDHSFLHSLVGALTLGVLAAVIVTRVLYSPLISFFFGVDRDKLDKACEVSSALVISCMLGALFHLIVDIPMHPYNPVFWPWVDPYAIVGVLVLFFAEGGNIGLGFARANALLSIIMIVLGGLILLRYIRENLWERVWLGNSTYRDEPFFE